MASPGRESTQNTAESVLDGLLQRIRDRSAIVGVVGLGYVGLPLAVEKAKVGFHVVGIDQNEKRAAMVRRGENYISDVRDDELRDLVSQGILKARSDFDSVHELDVIVIAVPTPLTRNLTPDLHYVENVTRAIARQIRPGQLVSLESTTYPGTTEELMLPILESSGLRVEESFFLAHSPERVDPGNKRYTTKNTSKVVGGVGPRSLQAAMEFYGQTIQHMVPVSSAKAAELVKVFENTFRAVNIAMVNELAMLCHGMNLNVWEVLDAAFTKPFGIMPFYPGPGVGGHCIPIDPHYLEWKAKELGFHTRFIALAGETNRSMPQFVVDRTRALLNARGIAVSRSRILALGAAYKKGLEDSRESPAVEIMRMLKRDGATIHYHDPFVPHLTLDSEPMESSALTPETLSSHDLALILTDHDEVDYAEVVRHSPQVFDTRNATRHVNEGRERIVLL